MQSAREVSGWAKRGWTHMKKVFEGGPRAPIRASAAEGRSSLCSRAVIRVTCALTKVEIAAT